MRLSANEKLAAARSLSDMSGLSLNKVMSMASKAYKYRLMPISTSLSLNEQQAAADAVAFFNAAAQSMPIEAYSALNIAQNRSRKTGRLRKSIKVMYNHGSLVFGTLTFTNECLAATAEATRRTYVSRYLKFNFAEYRANIDYGDTTNREHYHFIAVIGDTEPLPWKYGFYKFENFRDGSELQVARYINKLANHATKCAPRIIYSRKSKILYDFSQSIDNLDQIL